MVLQHADHGFGWFTSCCSERFAISGAYSHQLRSEGPGGRWFFEMLRLEERVTGFVAFSGFSRFLSKVF